MDEEKCTSVYLRECLRAFSEHVFLVNTEFLDKAGCEGIHR